METDSDVEEDADAGIEDDEDFTDLFSPDEEEDSQAPEGGIRQDFVDRALKALVADAARCDGELNREDVNRIYVRRELTIAECAHVEVELGRTGIVVVESDELASDYREDTSSSFVSKGRRLRYLTDIEERELGRKIQIAVRLAETGGSGDTEFDKRIVADAEKAKATFVAANIRYVEKLARKRGERRHMALEDIVQEGVIGLLRATDLYDPELGFRFKTYATWWIEQRMRRAIADGDRIVRLPVHLQETISRIRRSRAKLTLANGRTPSPEQLAHALGMDSERLVQLLWRVQATDCVEGDAPVGEDGTIITLRADEGLQSAFDMASSQELRERFASVLATLSPREERVIRMRFGLGLDEDHTLESVGQLFGVTRERIRQIEAKALKKLKHHVRSKHLRGFMDQA